MRAVIMRLKESSTSSSEGICSATSTEEEQALNQSKLPVLSQASCIVHLWEPNDHELNAIRSGKSVVRAQVPISSYLA
jgi:hypothetical protein